MDKDWFTADEHYFHKNIIKYEDRPFKDVECMNGQLIENHNNLVSVNDTVYHCGDFCFAGQRKFFSIISKLNGKHVFVKGNHDGSNRVGKEMQQIDLKINGIHIILNHYPMLRWNRSHVGSWQLFGHCHSNLKETEYKQYNIGVDCNKFKPVSFEFLEEFMKYKKITKHH